MCLGVIIILILLCLVYIYFNKAKEVETYREMNDIGRMRTLEFESKKRKETLQKAISEFENSLKSYFNDYEIIDEYASGEKNYCEVLKILKANIEVMKQCSNSGSMMDEIFLEGQLSKYVKCAEQFKEFGERIEKSSMDYMLDINNYGYAKAEYLSYIKSMNKEKVNSILNNINNALDNKQYNAIWNVKIKTIVDCVWFYAMNKPYSVIDFEFAKKVFYRLDKRLNIEIFIAEAYAIKQLGSEAVLRKKVDKVLKNSNQYCVNRMGLDSVLATLASGLMWIKAFDEEKIVLQDMLEHRIPMSEKLQERLHILLNGGEDAPNTYNVQSRGNQMYFDVSSLTWKDKDYDRLFEDLSFKEKKLTYSLAVRDENKELFIPQTVNIPDHIMICNKLIKVFQEEYGSGVVAGKVNGVALSGNGNETMEGIIARTNECKQLGIFVHVAKIGKKLNIKFYTFFIPVTEDISEQKQQAMSLYKKLSPSVAMWESSLKDTILMAIQQLLNVGSSEQKVQNERKYEEPIEF